MGARKFSIKPPAAPNSDINITPLVDVVLVLLIIFMVVTPLLTKQFSVQLPKDEAKVEPPPDQKKQPVLLQVHVDGHLSLNNEKIEKGALRERLRRVFAARDGDHTLFFNAEDDAPYGNAVEALDIARAGGAVPIAILTEKPRS